MSRATDPSSPADSAGTPWAGRHFEATAYPGDDGSVPAALTDALARFRAGEAGEEAVVDAVRGIRLLVPLVATLGETDFGDTGLVVDKSAELALVTVAGPDGRRVLPAFGSVDAMRTWNPDARPVPVGAVRAALAAAAEETELIVLDPGSPTQFALRRPAVWAIARSLPWLPSHRDQLVDAAFQASVADEAAVVALVVVAGDPAARLEGPEVVVRLAVRSGLTRDRLAELLARVQGRWTSDEVIAGRVDSLAMTLVAVE